MKQCGFCGWWDRTVPSSTAKGKGYKCSITGKTKLASEGKYCKSFCNDERTQ